MFLSIIINTRVNRKITIYLIPILFLCFTVCGCKKSKEKKITGTWEVINVMTQTPDFVEYWKFESDGTVARYRLPTGGSLTEEDKGTWKIQQKIDKAFVTFEFSGMASQQDDYNNPWRIHKLSKKVMILILIDEGQNTKEFKSSSLL